MATKKKASKNPYNTGVGAVSFTVGAETSNAVTVNVQIKDNGSKNVAVRKVVKWFLADDANGDTFTATAAAGGVAAGTNGWVATTVTGKSGIAMTEANGTLDIVVTHATGAKTWYLGIVLSDGSVVMSTVLTFT